MRLTCPFCHQPVTAPQEVVGKKAQCPNCRRAFVVAQSVPTESTPALAPGGQSSRLHAIWDEYKILVCGLGGIAAVLLVAVPSILVALSRNAPSATQVATPEISAPQSVTAEIPAPAKEPVNEELMASIKRANSSRTPPETQYWPDSTTPIGSLFRVQGDDAYYRNQEGTVHSIFTWSESKGWKLTFTRDRTAAGAASKEEPPTLSQDSSKPDRQYVGKSGRVYSESEMENLLRVERQKIDAMPRGPARSFREGQLEVLEEEFEQIKWEVTPTNR